MVYVTPSCILSHATTTDCVYCRYCDFRNPIPDGKTTPAKGSLGLSAPRSVLPPPPGGRVGPRFNRAVRPYSELCHCTISSRTMWTRAFLAFGCPAMRFEPLSSPLQFGHVHLTVQMIQIPAPLSCTDTCSSNSLHEAHHCCIDACMPFCEPACPPACLHAYLHACALRMDA